MKHRPSSRRHGQYGRNLMKHLSSSQQHGQYGRNLRAAFIAAICRLSSSNFCRNCTISATSKQHTNSFHIVTAYLLLLAIFSYETKSLKMQFCFVRSVRSIVYFNSFWVFKFHNTGCYETLTASTSNASSDTDMYYVNRKTICKFSNKPTQKLN